MWAQYQDRDEALPNVEESRPWPSVGEVEAGNVGKVMMEPECR